MTRWVCWSVVLLVLAGFVAVLADLLRARREAGLDMPAFSVYSDADDGLAEAAHVLGGLGWTPVALTRPVQVVRHEGLLLVVEPIAGTRLQDEGGLGPADAEALLRWVARGNTVLLCSSRNTPLHQALGVLLTQEAEPHEAFTSVELERVGAYTEGVKQLSVGTRATLQGGLDALPLWSLEGLPAALVVRHGKGRVIVVADPRWLSRAGLTEPTGQPRDDNAVFLANVASLHAAGGKVYFDEYHHGIRSGGGFWAYLAYHGQRWTLLLLLLVVAVAVWRVAVRLGPAVPLPRTAQADAVDYASGLGRLYQRAGARRRLARALARGFVASLTRHLHLRRAALPAVILAAWRQQHRSPAGTDKPDPSTARLQELLRGVNALRKGDVRERELLNWTRAFDQFIKEVDSCRSAHDN
jgi:hypothetical protein